MQIKGCLWNSPQVLLVLAILIGIVGYQNVPWVSAATPMPSATATSSNHIVFAARQNDEWKLFVIDANGSNLRLLTDKGGPNPIWSPDGREILFVTGRIGSIWEINLINTDGSNRRTLLRRDVDNLVIDDWSPDGKKIAFSLERWVPIEGTSSNELWAEMFMMNADGSGTQLLMNTVRPYYVYGAKWAPNGRFISYTAGAGGCNGIEVMDADATNSRPLAGYSRTEGVCAGSPAWAPDSKSIAFVFDHGMQPNGVYVVDRDGRNLRLIGAEGFEPVWSPDGRAIAFASSLADGKGFLNIVDTKGEDRRQADIGFTKGAPCWTSDSAHLIFVSDRGKFDTIYRLDADGRNLHALTTTYLGELFDPACQPTLPR